MMGDWTFFSNYGHVLVCLARNHQARLRDVARDVGITERAVQKIVRDLQDAGFLTVTKQGRCNRYRINRRKSLRHPLQSHCTVGKMLALIAPVDRFEHSTVVPETDEVKIPRGQAADDAPASGPRPEAATISADGGDVDREVGSAEPSGAVPSEVEVNAAVNPPEPKTDSEKESKKKRSPADTRQQGSLF
jgi:hypothetical protein